MTAVTDLNINSKQAQGLTNVFNCDLAGVLEAIPAGLLILDKQGIVTFANPCAGEIFDGELVGQTWIAIIEMQISPQIDDGHEISLKNGKRVSIATQALSNEKGQLIVINDLTQTRHLQQQVAQNERLVLMGKMMAQLAHQVRTPLATAMLYANNIKTQALPMQKIHKFSDKIIHNLNHLEQQIKDMLQFSKGTPPTVETLSSTEVIAELLLICEARLQAAGIELKIHDKEVRFWANSESLLGALQNLVNNAIQACEVDPEISLRVSERGENIEFCVTDNGCGMSEAVQKDILKPFFTTKKQGTGLGLAIVQICANAHDGELWIESSKEQGSSIGLRIPKYKRNHLRGDA